MVVVSQLAMVEYTYDETKKQRMVVHRDSDNLHRQRLELRVDDERQMLEGRDPLPMLVRAIHVLDELGCNAQTQAPAYVHACWPSQLTVDK